MSALCYENAWLRPYRGGEVLERVEFEKDRPREACGVWVHYTVR